MRKDSIKLRTDNDQSHSHLFVLLHAPLYSHKKKLKFREIKIEALHTIGLDRVSILFQEPRNSHCEIGAIGSKRFFYPYRLFI